MFKVLSILAVLSGLALVSTGTARADPPDFSICEGLTGAALGLCRAGVAAGCADGTGNPTACMEIEDTFMMVTGGDGAPWTARPPTTCPCPYTEISMDAGEWQSSVDFNEIQFLCNADASGVDARFIAAASGGGFLTPEMLVITAGTIHLCAAVEAGGGVIEILNDLTLEEARDCRLDIIDYATEFVADNPLVAVDDQCTGM